MELLKFLKGKGLDGESPQLQVVQSLPLPPACVAGTSRVLVYGSGSAKA